MPWQAGGSLCVCGLSMAVAVALLTLNYTNMASKSPFPDLTDNTTGNVSTSQSTDNVNSFVQTLDPYEPDRDSPHQSSRGRGGGRGRGRGQPSHRNNHNNEENDGWINPSQKQRNLNQRRHRQRRTRQLASTHVQYQNARVNHFTKYYSVKFPRTNIHTELNVIAV